MPKTIPAASLTAEEVLFLAIHAQKPLVERIAEGDQNDKWIDAIAAGFASLLQHGDLEDHDRIYHGSSPWHDAVRPPSVIATVLLMFLGRLSVANESVYDGCRKRGAIQGFLCALENLPDEWLAMGAKRQRERQD